MLLDFLEIFPYWFCISAQNNKFSIAVFFSKCDQICSFLCNGKHHFLCSASLTFIISFFEDWSEKLFFLTSYDFDSWTFKKIKTLKIQKHSSQHTNFTQMIWPLKVWHVYCCHIYSAGRGWWKQAGLVPCDQKFSCKWHLSFSHPVALNEPAAFLASLSHITSSLISHIWFFMNAILRKMSKLGFPNFKPIFLRMKFL